MAQFRRRQGRYPKHLRDLRSRGRKDGREYEEALEIIEQAWTQERFSYEGKFWQIPELSLSPKPLQKPHPPIYRGLASPEAFEPAGVKGHGALFVPWLTPETRLKEGIARYHATLRTQGHQAVPSSVFMFFLFIDQDYRQALAEAQETTNRYVELSYGLSRPRWQRICPPTIHSGRAGPGLSRRQSIWRSALSLALHVIVADGWLRCERNGALST